MNDSVSVWMLGLQDQDDESLRRLWARYFDRVISAARKRLGSVPKRAFDEEDVAVSVFASLCRGAQEGRFANMTNRDDLWRILMAITRQKVVDQIRRETRKKRGGGQVRGESVFCKSSHEGERAGLEALAASEPTPSDLAAIEEQARQLMEQLPEAVRPVAQMRLEGYENEEIARHLGVSLSTIERKLRLTRKVWIAELEPA